MGSELEKNKEDKPALFDGGDIEDIFLSNRKPSLDRMAARKINQGARFLGIWGTAIIMTTVVSLSSSLLVGTVAYKIGHWQGSQGKATTAEIKTDKASASTDSEKETKEEASADPN